MSVVFVVVVVVVVVFFFVGNAYAYLITAKFRLPLPSLVNSFIVNVFATSNMYWFFLYKLYYSACFITVE